MVKLIRQGVYFMDGHLVKEAQAFMTSDKREKAVKNTVAHAVLSAHTVEEGGRSVLKADAVAVGGRDGVSLMQTVLALGAETCALPLTLGGVEDCGEGSLRADENEFLSRCAKRFGADFVPASLSSDFGFLRDLTAKSGQVYLGFQSAGFGALGALAVGAEREELACALAGKPFGFEPPQTVAVYLRGKPRKGVGPVDIALALLQTVRQGKFAEGKLFEFFGAGLSNLSMDTRNMVDAFMAESDCFGTVWETDERTEEFFKERGRAKAYKHLAPKQPAYYDWGVMVDLTRIEPMLAFPRLAEICTVREFAERPSEFLLRADPSGALSRNTAQKKAYLTQAIVGGSYEAAAEFAEIMRGGACGAETFVSVRSQAELRALAENGYLADFALLGAEVRGAGSRIPATVSGGFSVGCFPGEGAYCMDTRSIAFSLKSGGAVTSALDGEYAKRLKKYKFDPAVYAGAFRSAGKADGNTEISFATVPCYPAYSALPKHLLLKLTACGKGALSETDLLSDADFFAHRSQPMNAAEKILAATDAQCAVRGAAVRTERENKSFSESVKTDLGGFTPVKGCEYGGAMAAGKLTLSRRGGLTALCLRAFGCMVFVCKEYGEGARAALVNAGIVPLVADKIEWRAGDTLLLEGLTDALKRGDRRILVKVFSKGKTRDAVLYTGSPSAEEVRILLAGGQINADKVSE